MTAAWWEGFATSAGPALLILVVGWLLTRRRDAAKAKVENDATVVSMITEAMNELRQELQRARAIAVEAETTTKAAQDALRRLASELDQFGRALAAHREWDEKHARDDAPSPPPLPTVPRWWEAVGPPFRFPDRFPEIDEPI